MEMPNHEHHTDGVEDKVCDAENLNGAPEPIIVRLRHRLSRPSPVGDCGKDADKRGETEDGEEPETTLPPHREDVKCHGYVGRDLNKKGEVIKAFGEGHGFRGFRSQERRRNA